MQFDTVYQQMEASKALRNQHVIHLHHITYQMLAGINQL
jgi:hypothetical protein